MIPNQQILVKMGGRNIKWFRSLGYNVGMYSTIEVPVTHLNPGSEYKIVTICDECFSISINQYKDISNRDYHICKPCHLKNSGEVFKKYNSTSNPMRVVGETNPCWNPNTPAYKKYAGRVYHLTKKIYNTYKEEINPNNYPRTLCGVDGGYQLDHIISVKEGFDNGIPPEEIAKKENLQMLTWQENRAKW